MLFNDHPFTRELHRDWRDQIQSKFPTFSASTHEDYLSIYPYISQSPQRFYSKQAFSDYLVFLNNLKVEHLDVLKGLFAEYERELSLAFKYLDEINQQATHEQILPSEDPELILWVDKNVNYNYLRMIEGIWGLLIHPIAYFDLIERGKNPDSLKQIMSRVDILNKGGFSYLTDCYHNIIRNGIAHGDVSYKDREIVFRDNKGNVKELGLKEFVRWFDRGIDYCNGITLAIKIFFLSELEFFQQNEVPIPKQILIEELKASANAPDWEVLTVLDSHAPAQNKTQLLIFTKNSVRTYEQAVYYCFRTAVLAEKFATGYERYFFNLKSKYALPGWGGFDGKLLAKFRTEGITDLQTYMQALENGYVFFSPNIKVPKIYRTLTTLWMAFRTEMPREWQKYLDTYWPNPFVLRDVQSHRKRTFIAVIDPSVVIKEEFQQDIPALIRTRKKKIIKRCIKAAKRQYGRFSLNRNLPVKYIRAFVYETDLRQRHLRHSGLISDLVCSIEVNSSSVKTIDLLGGKVEVHGKYRIVWNRNWSGFETIGE